jgi:hypothetical protein
MVSSPLSGFNSSAVQVLMSNITQTPETGLPVAGGFILRPATAADFL